MLVCVPLFIHLGQWQHGKADRKRAAQGTLDARRLQGRVQVPGTRIQDAEALRYAPVTVRGEFDVAHQILIDNRIYNEIAGYHVITPLRIAGSDLSVLVNRGWIAAPADHSRIPRVTTPVGTVDIAGTAVLPATRYFELGTPVPSNEWQTVWQNLDVARFQTQSHLRIQPIVIELDPDQATAGFGFVRDWPRPDERWEMHLSYALQWYGFAISAVLIWFVLSWRKP